MLGQSNFLPHLILTLDTGGPYKADGTIVIYSSPNNVDLTPVGEFKIMGGLSVGEATMYSGDPTDIQLVTNGTLMAKEGGTFDLVPAMVTWASNQLTQPSTILKVHPKPPKASDSSSSLAPAWVTDNIPWIVAGGVIFIILGYVLFMKERSTAPSPSTADV